jgi:hypothetical protein
MNKIKTNVRERLLHGSHSTVPCRERTLKISENQIALEDSFL